MSKRKHDGAEGNGEAMATTDRVEDPQGLPAPETPAEPAPEPPEDDRPNMPVFIARFSLVRACVWKNETDQGTRYQTTFSRLYMGADNRWHTTQAFGYRDLPLIEKCAAAAFGWIAERLAESDVPF